MSKSARHPLTSKLLSILLVFAMSVFSLFATAPASNAVPGVVPGAGFTVSISDLQFILNQIRMAESHAATLSADTRTPVTPVIDGTGVLRTPILPSVSLLQPVLFQVHLVLRLAQLHQRFQV